MRVLIAVKRVVDYNLRVRARKDGTGVDLANLKMSMNPFDEIALEEAVRLHEQGIADDLVAVSIGAAACQETLRTALALGAHRAVLIETQQEVEPLAAAKLLQSIVARESPQLVIMGKQAIDSDANQTGQMLAGLLGWCQATFACGLKIADGIAEVSREVDGGTRILRMRLPAVVTADLRLNVPRYVKLPNIMKAKSKPLEVVSAADLGVDLEPRLRALGYVDPPARSGGVKVADAAELVARLRNEAKVI